MLSVLAVPLGEEYEGETPVDRDSGEAVVLADAPGRVDGDDFVTAPVVVPAALGELEVELTVEETT